ncbi:MAG: T9SS type A sorting domain-containing protein [Bacteroidetes bacterium]|nr:T9SS type A sorting domain-containing protein [Bacteroidota bacterium]
MKKVLLFLFIALLMNHVHAQTATDGDYRSAATGNWSSNSTWQVRSSSSWAAAVTPPTSTNNVYIQNGHTVTVDIATAQSSDLHVHTSGVLAVGTNVIQVNGKIRAYTGTVVTTIGADGTFYSGQVSSTNPGANSITTGTGGKVSFVGNTRNITNTGEWGATLTGGEVEIALSSGQTGTLNTNFKAKNWTMTSGILDANTRVMSADNGTTGGTVNITNGFLLKSTVTGSNNLFQRTGSSTVASVTLAPGATIQLGGAAPQIAAASIAFNGTVEYNRAGAQVLLVAANSGATPTYNNLTISGSGTKTLSSNTSVVGTLTIGDGTTLGISTFTCTLTSTSPTSSASIAAIGTGAISYGAGGAFAVQRYLTAQRAYRLLGHPFSGNIALSGLQPYVDITGSGIGLTSGNPSAYNYTTGVWSAYVNNTDTWNKNEALLLFVRGTPGQGINVTDGSYSPTAPTISLSGSVNTGNINYTVKAAGSFSNGSATGWNAIGNPYPSAIDVNSIGNITAPGGSGASIYVWNATKGSTGSGAASGGYDYYTLGSSIIIPTYGAFFIKNTSGADQTINFTESNKNTGTPMSLLGVNTIKEGFDLIIEDNNNTYWDKLSINYSNSTVAAATDKTDLEKFSNINLDFYSISSDKVKLAVNNRPALQASTDKISLGLNTNQQRSFIVKASNVNLPSANGELYLHDIYTGDMVKIEAGMSYGFEVTSDSKTKGEGRFELLFINKAIATLPATTSGSFTAKLLGNVITNNQPIQVQVQNASANAVIQVKDINGRAIATQAAVNGLNTINVSRASLGMYIVQTTDGNNIVTDKVIKQ